MEAPDKHVVEGIQLQSGKQAYKVPDFSTAYNTYTDVCADKRFGSNLLVIIGAAIVLLGVGIWMSRPETIYYNRLVGPTFLQHMQAAPHLVMMVGSFFIALAQKVRGEAQLSPELFLLTHYTIVGVDGSDVRDQVDIQHLADDDFNIVFKPQS